MPPFSSVGISAASTAMGLPSGPEAASGSRMSREASWSLVPWARCTFRVVGACQYRIFSWPPTPRPPAVVAGLVVAAIVGAGVGGQLKILYWQAPTTLNVHLPVQDLQLATYAAATCRGGGLGRSC